MLDSVSSAGVMVRRDREGEETERFLKISKIMTNSLFEPHFHVLHGPLDFHGIAVSLTELFEHLYSPCDMQKSLRYTVSMTL